MTLFFPLAVRVQGKEREEEESEHRGFCRRGQSGAAQETQGMCSSDLHLSHHTLTLCEYPYSVYSPR